MSLAPVLDADHAVRWHMVSAPLALLLGPVALMPRSRDRWRCSAGTLWIAAMSSTAVCSLLIAGRAGRFSPLHLLTLFLL